MPRLAANLSWLYSEQPFLQRFRAAAEAGFAGVEFLFPYEHEAAKIKHALDENRLSPVLFNGPPGDFARGERGLAALPGREKDFRESLKKALEYSDTLQVPRLHIMSGIVDRSEREAASGVLRHNLEFALQQLDNRELELLLEPINSRDIPGYFLTTLEEAATLINQLSHPRLKLQLDWYHAQIMGGDLARRTEHYLNLVGHIQLASVPDRNEPDRGEINYAYLLRQLDRLAYRGWVGCEYKPRTTTGDGLAWATPWLHGTSGRVGVRASGRKGEWA